MSHSRRIPLIAESSQRSRTSVLRMLRHIDFECRTREQADDVADAVAALLPEPVSGRLGMVELLLNAIEHGNLEIGGALKAELLRDQRFEDELAARLASQPYASRTVHVSVAIDFPQVEVEIRDDGPGFAWRDALAADVFASAGPSGRGLAIVSQACFPTLVYREPGNIAVVTATWSR